MVEEVEAAQCYEIAEEGEHSTDFTKQPLAMTSKTVCEYDETIGEALFDNVAAFAHTNGCS